MQYKELPLIAPLQKAIAEIGYTNPTPIQETTIPIVLKGNDLLGCAQTGTGKTAAFTLPILQKLEHSNPKDGIKALIVTPTRELAIQIDDCIKDYGKYMNVKHTAILGGVNANPQIAKIRDGLQILVATPGRLLDLHSQGHINLNKIEVLVLDEADRMLDMGFIADIKQILKIIPKKRQTLFFSATMPDSIIELSKKILTKPKNVNVSPVSSTADRVEQHLYYVEKSDKRDLLLHVLKNEELDSVLIFTRTKYGADRIVKLLNKANISAAAIHSNKSQNARQKALAGFKNHDIRVLIATDIAARGIDVDGISHVINFELPNQAETYVHRIGRTGRAGREGIAISFCEESEIAYLKDIEKLIAKEIDVIEDNPYEFYDGYAIKIGKIKARVESKNASKGNNSSNRASRNGNKGNSRKSNISSSRASKSRASKSRASSPRRSGSRDLDFNSSDSRNSNSRRVKNNQRKPKSSASRDSRDERSNKSAQSERPMRASRLYSSSSPRSPRSSAGSRIFGNK